MSQRGPGPLETTSSRPLLASILTRHGLWQAGLPIVAGVGASHPTYLHGDAVVKLFRADERSRRSFRAERSALAAAATDPHLCTPRLLAEGEEAARPYLVTTRLHGEPWDRAALSPEMRRALAAELGGAVARLHRLPAADVATVADWAFADLGGALSRSVLPPRLAAQAPAFLSRLAPSAAGDVVVVHADLIARHVLVAEGKLCGIIDLGDAMVCDRHHELAKLHLDLFAGDKELLRIFLAAGGWHPGADFARRALGEALLRQAHGLEQHDTMDVFHLLPAIVPLAGIATLDDLARALFEV